MLASMTPSLGTVHVEGRQQIHLEISFFDLLSLRFPLLLPGFWPILCDLRTSLAWPPPEKQLETSSGTHLTGRFDALHLRC